MRVLLFAVELSLSFMRLSSGASQIMTPALHDATNFGASVGPGRNLQFSADGMAPIFHDAQAHAGPARRVDNEPFAVVADRQAKLRAHASQIQVNAPGLAVMNRIVNRF